MSRKARTQLLISVKPRFAHAILRGDKLVELRRVRPNLTKGDEIILYESSPTCAVVARAKVAELIEATPLSLWRLIHEESGVTRQEFNQYFAGRSRAFAIRLSDVQELDEPIGLRELRRAVPGFAPPQSYHYLRPERQRDLELTASLPE